MNLIELFENKEKLNAHIQKYIHTKKIIRIKPNRLLSTAHLDKAKHNLRFFSQNTQNEEFTDWLIVTLYYTLYHCALALITNRQYTSKNHTATILILIKEYTISKEEAELIEELAISKKDAELYTNLKSDRQNASYATTAKFSTQTLTEYRKKVLDFLQKSEEILEQS